MATNIQWVINPDGSKGETWNPVTGCTPISEGCKNCYAKRMHERFLKEPFSKVTLHNKRLNQSFGKKPKMIFINSMSDTFHPDVPFEFVDRIMSSIVLNQIHTYVILTKRIERAHEYFTDLRTNKRIASLSGFYAPVSLENFWNRWPLKNLWLGVTAENQEQADKRIPVLLTIPAAKHFVSVEPMLGEIDSEKYLSPIECTLCNPSECEFVGDSECRWVGNTPSSQLDLVICGTESGTKRRPVSLGAIRNLRDQCVDAGVPFFLKQMEVNGRLVKMPTLDGQIWNQIPERG